MIFVCKYFRTIIIYSVCLYKRGSYNIINIVNLCFVVYSINIILVCTKDVSIEAKVQKKKMFLKKKVMKRK